MMRKLLSWSVLILASFSVQAFELATHRVSKNKTVKLRKIYNYLKKNQDRMHYDKYLEEGYPVDSGVIEGACRHLVKDRMERAGIRWTIKWAQSMLDIRSVYLNEHQDEFTKFRIKKINSELYPDREMVEKFA